MDLATLELAILLLLAWTLPWKGIAMWKAARKGHKIWFIVFLLVNTIAILEILYIFWFSKISKKKQQKKSKDKLPKITRKYINTS
ncbi:MAG: DUF5652 family protein [Candidatus Pacearchaeota archaeon]|nr:DUF5652 family protein [Candidatus Pacearchaeota archaeon]